MSKVVIYTDGGARGNPGPAAIGVVIEMRGPKSSVGGRVREYGEVIGEATNNVAEYSALIFALKKAKQLLGNEKAKATDLEVRSDSELMVSQLKGEYKVKSEDLKPFFMEAWNLRQEFSSVSFIHIPREENSRADALVNRALDTALKTQLHF